MEAPHLPTDITHTYTYTQKHAREYSMQLVQKQSINTTEQPQTQITHTISTDEHAYAPLQYKALF